MALFTVIGGALFGAVLGYMLRVREWQREKRLAAYTEFVASFFDVNRKALVVFLTDRGTGERWIAAYREFEEVWERFGASRGQVSLLATDRTYIAANNCNGFVAGELWPRFRERIPEPDARRLQWDGLKLEQVFIYAAARELGPRLLARRKTAMLKGARPATGSAEK
jgi:hypothetical protein